MKKCVRCKIDKDLEQYSKSSGYISGINSRCKKCMSIVNRENYAKRKADRKSHRIIEGVAGVLSGCLYKENTNLITNVYSYPSNRK